MRFRVAAIQMSSTPHREANLREAARLLEEAARSGAMLAALPENFSFLRTEDDAAPDPEPYAPATDGPDGPVTMWLRGRARTLGLWILGGSVPERLPPGSGDDRRYNTSLLLNPEGKIVARYRKIHLFDVAITGGPVFEESKVIAPGDAPVIASTPFGAAGLTICYDLRFPELYRALALAGARVVFVPSAFTAHTGKDHWEPLLRARAIENQCYVVAPAQVGRHSPRRASHGRALIVDPWGIVLAQASDRPSVILANLDAELLDEVRRDLPALEHVRKDLFFRNG
jgi:predicted amidohydrolase